LRIDNPLRAQRLRLFTTGGDRVGGDHAGAEVARYLHVHQTDRPQPDHQFDFTRIEAQHILAAQHTGQRLHHGRGFQAGGRAQRMDVALRHAHIIGVAAAVLQKGGALAAVGAPGATGFADAALDDHVGRHRLADFQSFHVFAYGGHGPRDLVAQDAGKGDRRGKPGISAYIPRTDGRVGDLDQHIVVAHLVHGQTTHLHRLGALTPHGAHCIW
jgi:hypothetical protein